MVDLFSSAQTSGASCFAAASGILLPLCHGGNLCHVLRNDWCNDSLHGTPLDRYVSSSSEYGRNRGDAIRGMERPGKRSCCDLAGKK